VTLAKNKSSGASVTISSLPVGNRRSRNAINSFRMSQKKTVVRETLQAPMFEFEEVNSIRPIPSKAIDKQIAAKAQSSHLLMSFSMDEVLRIFTQPEDLTSRAPRSCRKRVLSVSGSIVSEGATHGQCEYLHIAQK
jgi:hypothetical protein